MSESTPPLSAPTAELVSGLLRDGIDVRLRLSGWSMKPLVPSGSIVQFSSAPNPDVGDIVLIRHLNDTLVAHRVIGLGSDFVLTKGDSCATADGPVARDQVVGCAVRLEGRPISLPLRSVWMRRLGLALNFFYPKVVARYRALVPRPKAVDSERGVRSC